MRPRALVRIAFIAYAAALALATHWPQLRIDGPVVRTDLYIHVAAFALWTALLIASEFTGPWRTATARARAAAIGLLYATLDETTQAIPILGRTFGLDDLAADYAGVLLAVAAAFIAAHAARRGAPPP